MHKYSLISIDINETPSYEDTYSLIIHFLKNDKPEYITVNNVHTVTEASLNKEYKNILNNSFLSLPDGKPLAIVAKLKGVKNISRIFGPTLLERALEWGQKDNLKHFLFGSSSETLSKLILNVKEKYPNAIIAGSYSPPYKKQFTTEENEQFIKLMNESNADIFWVALGAPKQEIWMYENYRKLNRGIMIGIGAGFDYLAGNIKHAPEWMKDYALEWVYRLIQEPGRLWKRYLVTNSLFLWFVFLEMTGIKKFK